MSTYSSGDVNGGPLQWVRQIFWWFHREDTNLILCFTETKKFSQWQWLYIMHCNIFFLFYKMISVCDIYLYISLYICICKHKNSVCMIEIYYLLCNYILMDVCICITDTILFLYLHIVLKNKSWLNSVKQLVRNLLQIVLTILRLKKNNSWITNFNGYFLITYSFDRVY